MRLSQFLLISVALVGLASCSSPKEASVSIASPAAKSAPVTEQGGAAGFTALQSVITKTETAVEAGNFDQAKTEFEKFEDSWKTVEDGVKVKSKDTYSAIEDGMDNVGKGLKSKSKEATLPALQALSKSVTSAQK